MARHAEGWRIVWRRGIAHVRFRHEGKRYEFSCRTSDPGEARKTAARIYTEVVTYKRWLKPELASRATLIDLIAEWVHSLEGVLDPKTAREYEIQASAHWLPRWETLGEISEESIALYQRSRLRAVTRETLKKERSALSGFLEWCTERGHLRHVPEFPKLPRLASGSRAVPKRERVPLKPSEVERLLRALPERSKPHPQKPNQEPFRVRDFFIVLWETGLRPATVERLSSPENYSKGSKKIRLFDDADKARFHRDVPLTPRAREALDRSISGSGVIFGDHVWREYLRPISERVLRRRIAVDDFRHWRITNWLVEGKNIVGVQHLAGHKHLSTTARYTHPTFDAAARVLKGSR